MRTFSEVRSAISAGKTVENIVSEYLAKIDAATELNAFLEVFRDSALETAEKVDQKLAAGTAGRLAGVVIGIKDNICYRGHKVSAASKILENFESLYTATALQRLLDEDAVVIGRLNCDEFAMGSSNENSAYGKVKNNLRHTHVPGGSSGGSAVAVSAGLCTAALGSDTGGSIRQPASFTGTYGLKPTYGRISRYGLIAYASSFDQIGPFTNSVEDAALLYGIMAGKDEMDSTSSSRKVDEFAPNDPGKLRIGILKEAVHHEGIDPEVKKMLESAISDLRTAGHTVEEVTFPFIEQMVPLYYVLTTAEASSNLSRFDGVHFGYRSPEAQGVEEVYKRSRSEGFGKEVKRRIMAGTFVLSHGYYDAYYSKGQKVRRVMQDKTNEIFEHFDFLLMPTTPGTAFEAGSVTDPIQMYLQDIFTVHANITGNPAIAIPRGTHSNGLPMSLQIMGNHFEEKNMLNFADYLSKN